jgi:hypothetical protein
MYQPPQQQLSATPGQMPQPGMMHPQTPQQNRHTPMSVRPPVPPSLSQMGGVPPHAQAAYYTNAPRPSPMAGPAPATGKRYKASGPGPHPGAAGQVSVGVGGDPVMTIDEEEDTSRGDILDHLTPREIATTRFMQHHEWMEEIMSSAYSVNQIEPTPLGLGLAGELEGLTAGILDPPAHPRPKTGPKEPAKEKKDQKASLAELKKRLAERIARDEDELKRMDEAHTKRVEQFKRSAEVFKAAEEDLRIGVDFATIFPDIHLPGDDENVDDGSPRKPTPPVAAPRRTVEEVIRDIEAHMGRKIVPANEVTQHELPVEEIVNWGGVVAGEAAPNINVAVDTEMGDNIALPAIPDVGDEGFTLDIPTPITPIAAGANDTDTAGGMLDEFAQRAESEDQPIMEDSMMEDFMNVDDISKSASPQLQEQEPTAAAEGTTNATAATSIAIGGGGGKAVAVTGGDDILNLVNETVGTGSDEAKVDAAGKGQ